VLVFQEEDKKLSDFSFGCNMVSSSRCDRCGVRYVIWAIFGLLLSDGRELMAFSGLAVDWQEICFCISEEFTSRGFEYALQYQLGILKVLEGSVCFL